MSQDNHWMKFFVSDYIRDTRSLSQGQHGAYLLLLLEYWVTQKPIGFDMEEIYRIACAHNEEEKKNVDHVLSKFFFKKEDGFHNKKQDELIAEIQAKRAQNRANGAKGGRPKKTERFSEKNRTVFEKKPNGYENENRNHNRNETQTITETKPISEIRDQNKNNLERERDHDARACEPWKKYLPDAKACVQFLADLNIPNLMNFADLDRWLAAQHHIALTSRPELNRSILYELWISACRYAAERNKSSLNYIKQTFLNKIQEYAPENSKPAAPSAQPSVPTSPHSDPRVNRYLAAKRIRNRFTGVELDRSEYWDTEGRRNVLFYRPGPGPKVIELELSEYDVIE